MLQQIHRAWTVKEQQGTLNNRCLFYSYYKCFESTKLPFILNNLLTKTDFLPFSSPN